MTLQTYIDLCPTAFHGASISLDLLVKAGFKLLSEGTPWELKPGTSYVVPRGDGALTAFITGTKPTNGGFLMAAAHTDSPALRLKTATLSLQEDQLCGATDVYGGPIISTWLDRDLGLAGKVTALEGNTILEGYLKWDFPAARISNPPIHFDREINKGKEYNKQTELQVSFGGTTVEEFWKKLREDLKWGDSVEIVGTDLFFFPLEKSSLLGLQGDQLAAPRLDNLAMCHSLTTALGPQEASEKTKIIFLYDNEEVGSRTNRGADSGYTMQILERIHYGLGGTREGLYSALASSILLSTDAAHGSHPNFSKEFDGAYKPVLGKGPVVKINTNQRYATTSWGHAYFGALCKKAGAPLQEFIIRSDKPCGSTIGPAASALSGVETIDIGVPLLSMHSAREVISLKDIDYLQKVLEVFFQ